MVEFQVHNLKYYNRDLLPNTYLVPDQWGYNKIETSINRLFHNEFKTDSMGAVGSDCHPFNPRSSTLDQKGGYFSDRTLNSNPEYFSLKEITYPTGGKTVYEYESNRIASDNYIGWRHWGGIRIKTLTHLDGNVEKLKRSFSYGLNESGNGFPTYNIDHTDFRREYVIFPVYNPAGEYQKSRRAVDYSSFLQGDPEAAESRVYYSHVTEHFSSVRSNNGKITYSYNLPHLSTREPFPVQIFQVDWTSSGHLPTWPSMPYQGAPKFISNYQNWKKPLLAEKAYYSETNQLVKKETFTYIDKLYPTLKGVKIRPFARAEGAFNPNTLYYYDHISSFYNYDIYTIETGISLPVKMEETTYFARDAISTITTFSYNAHNQVMKETTTDSKNQVIEKHTIYSSDTPYWGGVFSSMYNANALNTILEQSVFKNNNLIKKVSYDYTELPGEIFVPLKSQKLNLVTQQLDDEILYRRHDNKGNILTISKAQDVMMSYIWSYKNKLPIAQVKGVNYETLESFLGVEALETFSSKAKPSKVEIDNFLSPLRTAIAIGSLANAELTSFEYDPFFGMVSETNFNGINIFYEYNNFGNLFLVRDHDGKVLKKYDYKYEGQPASTDMSCINTLPNWVNVGSPYCETANSVNTGKQLQNQIDNNPCSYSYNKTKTVTSINSTACPVTIYAKLSYENPFSFPTDSGADVFVRFYSDESCLNPFTVSDLQVNYVREGYDQDIGDYSYDFSITANGTYCIIQEAAFLRSYYPIGTLFISSDYILISGNYIIVL